MSLTIEARFIGEPNSTLTMRRHSLYSPELQLMAETNSSALTPWITNEYVWFNGEVVAQVNVPSGEIAYYFNDHLGAPILETDATGAVVWRVERDPYGERYATRVGADRHQPLGLPGQEYDASSDRQYNIARWYRPSWGRYTQSDPIHLYRPINWREPNAFLYAVGRPTRFVDSLGLFSWGDSCLGCEPDSDWPSERARYDQETRWLCESVQSFIQDRALADCIESRCQNAVIECKNNCPRVTDDQGNTFTPGAIADRAWSIDRPAERVTICTNANPPGRTRAGLQLIHEFAHNCAWRHGQGKGVPDPNTRGYL